MTVILPSLAPHPVATDTGVRCLFAIARAPSFRRFLGRKGGIAPTIAALLGLVPLACGFAAGQNTTTISGTVYDPRGSSGLPLPNVLVYASTNAVAAPAPGLQCLTVQNSTPTGSNVVAYTNTAVDGTFTLDNIPENASYTIVIQAGKWQRQFPETVAAAPLAGLVLAMPANHTEGNIPMIAIATGDGDSVECVLRDMGISDSEFTDDNETINPQGRIHLYEGSGDGSLGASHINGGFGGAVISPSTPSETLLMEGESTTPLNAYDMVMFPSQGGTGNQASPEGATNLLNFAEAGGRIFANDTSWVWLDPADGAQFGPVANWTVTADVPGDFQATVQTNFSEGATLARWLQNAGATVAGTSNQIVIGSQFDDVSMVIPPTQSWVTRNSGAYGTYPYVTITDYPVMQMTFDTPVGSPASSQCGRVWFATYFVIFKGGDTGFAYPGECPSYNNPSYTMGTTEKILEYSLFDLTSFVQPVGPPSITLTALPDPVFMTYAVSFEANVAFYANTPDGIMTFYDGTTEIGTATLSGYSATFTTSALAAGAHSITAVYSGDAGYDGPDTSNTVTENVQDFSLTFADGVSSATMTDGSQAVYTLVITPLDGATLPASVTLSASGVPPGTTATFSPATVTAGSGTTTVMLTIALPGKAANERPRGPFGGGPLPVALGLVLLPLIGRLRKGRARLAGLAVLVVIGAALAAGFTGCGVTLKPQNFSFTVTANSGSLAHSVTPQLTIQ